MRRAAQDDRYRPKEERPWLGQWEAEKRGPLVEQREMTPLEDIVRDLIEGLEPKLRDVLLMYEYERLSYREIAERMTVAGVGSSHETARRWHEQAKQIIREGIEERGLTP